jgi:hypothetical protein
MEKAINQALSEVTEEMGIGKRVGWIAGFRCLLPACELPLWSASALSENRINISRRAKCC